MANSEGIVDLHREISEAVLKYEKSADPALLSHINDGFRRFAQLVTLFLVSERDTYYGYFFMAMTFRPNPNMDAIAGILLDAYPPIFEANPLRLFKLSLKEILYVFCHEVDHVVFNHPAEMVRSNPEKQPDLFKLFNYAADASVNDQLNFEAACGKKFLAPPKGIITSQFISARFNIAQVAPRQDYLYYFNLIKDVALPEEMGNSKEPGFEGEPLAGGSSVESGGDEGAEFEEGSFVGGSAEEAGGSVEAGFEEGLLIGNHSWESSTGEDEEITGTLDEMLESATKEFLNNVNELMGAEARGMMPAYFIERLEQINAPAKLNWKQLLKKYVGTISAEKIKTKTRLNRRQPLRFDLSGTRESKTLKIAIAIDTSASMDSEQLRQIFAEVFAIVAQRRCEITVIECDAEVRNVYRITSPDDANLEVSGRGGTCFSPVIRYINDHRYFRDALLIYFTDGYGEKSIPRPRTYRNLWVISGTAVHLSVEQPYGLVLPLEDA